jgi:hypothetical protein
MLIDIISDSLGGDQIRDAFPNVFFPLWYDDGDAFFDNRVSKVGAAIRQ